MTTTPLFGEPTNDRKKAFPNVRSLSITIRQDVYGTYNSTSGQREKTFSFENFPSAVRCLNPLCKQGGLELANFVDFWENIENKDFPCNGHEGTPKGRTIAYPCGNRFYVTMTVERE